MHPRLKFASGATLLCFVALFISTFITDPETKREIFGFAMWNGGMAVALASNWSWVRR